MKLEVVKYVPNFMECDRQVQIVEIEEPLGSIYDVFVKVDYLKNKLGKLHYEFQTFTQTLIKYDSPNYDNPIPIAFVNLLEL